MSPKHQRALALTAAGALVVGGAIAATSSTQATAAAPENVAEVQILGINDFHGRLLPNFGSGEGGAAVLSGAVDALEASHPNTVFAAAGDLIGASTFESFINHDKPTIDALNAAGLDVSAVGNHEFDQGYDDLKNRVMAPYDAATNPFGGAEWTYLGANVKMKASGSPALDPSFVQTFNPGAANQVEVGFVGAVTEHLDELVAPAGIADIEVTDIPTAVNAEADALKAAGVDLIVLLVHEGASTTAEASATDPASDFGKIVNGVDEDVDAIISGHTHLAYNHTIAGRPVVSAGQYGMKLNQLVFDVDGAAQSATLKTNEIVNLVTPAQAGPPPVPAAAAYPADPAVTTIVEAAKTAAEGPGSVVLGEIGGPFKRPLLSGGGDNRGRESTLGNLVAEVQRAQTPATVGGAEIAFMNPGGLRKDMVGTAGELTYRQAADVQPFANTLVRMELTGAQIKSVLEEQWQPAGAARPFLRLGVSKGFTYTYDPAKPAGQRITEIRLHGKVIGSATTYGVTVNSFLATGGDNFATLNQGKNKKDTGVTDLQAMVDYMGAQTSPLMPEFGQHAVGVSLDKAVYEPGDTVTATLSSLSYTAIGDLVDTQGTVRVAGGTPISFPITTTNDELVGDEVGRATVSFKVPATAVRGSVVPVLLNGTTTGTTARFSVPVAPKTASTIKASIKPQRIRAKRTTVTLKVEVRGATKATGKVQVRFAGKHRTATLHNGKATIKLGKFKKPGKVNVTITYRGDANLNPATRTLTFRVRA